MTGRRRAGRTAGAGLTALILLLVPRVAAAQATGPVEVVAEIRVHGNHVTTDAEMLTLAGVAVGDAFTPAMLETVRRRLDATGRFLDVSVLKRYASIADPSQVSLVILVNEGPVRLEWPGVDDPDGVPRVVRRGFAGNFMWMPVLTFGDGYGATYGARVAWVGAADSRTRVSFPLTWGGHRVAGVDVSRTFTRGPVALIEGGVALQQDENPAYEIDDTRRHVWGRVEHATGPVRAGVSGAWQRIDFGAIEDDVRSFGVDVAFDTRRNPALPRNAVFVRAAWEQFTGATPTTLHQTRVDARGYVGLIRQSVFAIRVLHEAFDQPAPPYLQPFLGGASALRGFEAGDFVGDTRALASGEILVPVSSPLSVGQLGVSVFFDTGTAFEHGGRLRDARWQSGYGGSVWLTFPAFRVSLAVAHGRGAETRVHLGGGFTF